MIDYFRTGGPFYNALVNLFGENLAGYIRDTMVEGILTGQGPRYVGELLATTFGAALTWSLMTARTSMLYAYREATIAGYRRNSDIVQGWIWHAQLGSPRTCLSCIAQHGTFHTLDETLNDHHNGRCAMVPETKRWADLGVDANDPQEIQKGLDWFDALPADRQRQIMGPSMYDAWKDGRISTDDFSRDYHDSVYGMMKRTPSLRALLGPEAARYYP
jgi:hypothetical protein